MTQVRSLIPPISWQHALRELLMVVAGILIALWLNDWSDYRHDRRTELQLLKELRAALAEDLADNRTDYEAFQQMRTQLSRLQGVLLRRDPESPAVDSMFGVLATTRVLQMNTGPYEVMRARGFELLSNDSLRSRIVHYYGTTYPFMAMRYARVDDFVGDYAQAYLMRNFAAANRGGTPVHALSYDSVTRDPYLASLVNWHLADLGLMVRSYQEALAEGNGLLQALDRHMRELN